MVILIQDEKIPNGESISMEQWGKNKTLRSSKPRVEGMDFGEKNARN